MGYDPITSDWPALPHENENSELWLLLHDDEPAYVDANTSANASALQCPILQHEGGEEFECGNWWGAQGAQQIEGFGGDYCPFRSNLSQPSSSNISSPQDFPTPEFFPTSYSEWSTFSGSEGFASPNLTELEIPITPTLGIFDWNSAFKEFDTSCSSSSEHGLVKSESEVNALPGLSSMTRDYEQDVDVDVNVMQNEVKREYKPLPSPQNLKCTYETCPLTTHSFPTPTSLSNHHREHATTLLHTFIGPSRCPWRGCTSRAKFSSPKLLGTHLQNIHVCPMRCTIEGCAFQRGFRNRHDLERHRKTVHERVREFVCPFEGCRVRDGEGERVAFKRRDKLVGHLGVVHAGSGGIGEGGGMGMEIKMEGCCPIRHCGEKLGGEGMKIHLRRSHGGFECGLGRCGMSDGQSRFSDEGLEGHLKRDHGIENGEARRVVGVVKKVKDKTVRMENLMMGCRWNECGSCGD